ncbi:MAG: exo-alpha-sialidase [Bacteroidetes bacterium]|nr:exo-alpha-sialidase [Bacteroidota bacterium]
MAADLAVASVAGQVPGKAPASATNIIFQSADGGQTWQDISAGLPAGLLAEGFLAGDGELYLGTEHGMYRSSTTSKALAWEKEASLDDHSTNISAGSAGVFAYNNGGHFFQKLKGTGVWLPMFTNFPGYSVRTVFETKSGTVFIGCDSGIFKSSDGGKTWKHVFEDGWVIHMVESGGVLICTNQGGILRSTDGGEHWDVVLSEGGVGIAVEVIEGGFAAITYNTESETRRVRTSTDGGKTWQPIDAGLPPSSLISGIKQLGGYFFCGHPDGIFRSSDRGKTWELLLPSIGKKVFNLSVSGNVIYAVPRDGGC